MGGGTSMSWYLSRLRHFGNGRGRKKKTEFIPGRFYYDIEQAPGKVTANLRYLIGLYQPLILAVIIEIWYPDRRVFAGR